jgi:hypothetical protein
MTDEHEPIYICEMMDRLGIEPGGDVPRLSLSYMAAFHRCESCPSKQACRDWLEINPAPVLFAPCFCPNADIFFELQMDQPGPDRASRSQHLQRLGLAE